MKWTLPGTPATGGECKRQSNIEFCLCVGRCVKRIYTWYAECRYSKIYNVNNHVRWYPQIIIIGRWHTDIQRGMSNDICGARKCIQKLKNCAILAETKALSRLARVVYIYFWVSFQRRAFPPQWYNIFLHALKTHTCVFWQLQTLNTLECLRFVRGRWMNVNWSSLKGFILHEISAKMQWRSDYECVFDSAHNIFTRRTFGFKGGIRSGIQRFAI